MFSTVGKDMRSLEDLKLSIDSKARTALPGRITYFTLYLYVPDCHLLTDFTLL